MKTTVLPGQEFNPAIAPALLDLESRIEHAAHVLPAQGPITVFIHHNTLHAFEDSTFEEAVKQGAGTFSAHPYLPEEQYREALSRGRIRFHELRSVLEADLGDEKVSIPPHGTRLDLRLTMLQYPLRSGPDSELQWFVEETDALRKVRPETSAVLRSRLIAETRRWAMRHLRGRPENHGFAVTDLPDWALLLFSKFDASRLEASDEEAWEAFSLRALWEICRRAAERHIAVIPATHRNVRLRDAVVQAGGIDIDLLVNEVLIRFCAAFLDQGVAHWDLPHRDLGFFKSFCKIFGDQGDSPDLWRRGLAAKLRGLQADDVSPLELIRESLVDLGVEESDQDRFFVETLLALRGWGGMLRQLEVRGDRVAYPAPKGTFVEFVAVRLLLERFALRYAARESFDYRGSLSNLSLILSRRPSAAASNAKQRAFAVFQLAQVIGWLPQELQALNTAEWNVLFREIEQFTEIERRRVFHLAYECRFRTQTLDALALRPRRLTLVDRPRFQAIFCLDEREESVRRHLEEAAPEVETFGAAGFFGVVMYYRGATEAHYIPLCPIVVQPKHWVEEQVDDHAEYDHRRRSRARKAVGTAAHHFNVSSRSFALGAVVTATMGVLASIPLVARILFPRIAAAFRRRLGRLVQAPKQAQLRIERQSPLPGQENGSIGYSLDEMVNTAESLLRDIGLTQNFARLVFVIGHGSSSFNNPHKSAYDCGACGGSPGGPNGRAAAQILNDPRVRERLIARGLSIPADTWFVGSIHNTCNDRITLFDVSRIPTTHCGEFEAARRELDEACRRNAHERCRRFMSAPLSMTFQQAWEHVEERSEDLAQTRPELGHATNAICIVGRRERTRGLYLDRRSFLTSYDPTQDTPDRAILTRLLKAAVPVCAGINLEYYFSRIDSPGWGSGTKLPHNITSLLGVMDGAASDLRTGLPWQMVEVHEPVRLLFVIETTLEAMLAIMDRNEAIGKTIRNGWVQLAVLDPDSSQIDLFENGEFRAYTPEAAETPRAATSADWYRGWRDHLEFAEIG